jgi:3-hydroxypropanoate dehydrogenase
MKKPLDDAALDTSFREARSYNRWSPEPVPEKTLHALYDLLKLGPTSVNCCPARFVFVTSAAAKAMLVDCVSPGNVVKAEQAPVTVIVGMDEKFYEKIPFLFPQKPQMTLQGAYMMLAARSLGLDCGPMSGFDHAKIDAAFFAGTSVKSNFICALGSGTTEALFPRNPRLPFDEACRIV